MKHVLLEMAGDGETRRSPPRMVVQFGGRKGRDGQKLSDLVPLEDGRTSRFVTLKVSSQDSSLLKN